MPYLGNTPSTSFATVVKDSFSGDGSTVAFTLSKVATTNSVSVFVENVRQEPTTAYAVSGTTLTFTAAPVTSSGNNIYVLHMNPTTTTTHPSAQNLTAVNGTLTGTLGVTGASTLTGNVALGGTLGVTGATTTAAITASGIIKTDNTTDATSTTDGSLQTDGGLSVAKDAVIGDDLSLKSDSAVINFGVDSDVTLTHVADQGLTLKLPSTSGNSGVGPIFNISTGDTDIAAANQLGTINFQAPNEGTGTDAVAVAASITAIAQADFSASVNSTSLLLRSSNSGTNDGGYLEVTNAGPIRMTKQPVFICKFLGFESGTSNTNPASNYRTPAINIGSHFNASNGRFTAPVDGTYVFFGSVLSANNAVPVRIYFLKNGNYLGDLQHEARTTEGYSGYDKQFCHAVVPLDKNDYCELVIYQDQTNTFYATNADGYNSFSGYLIG